MTLSFPPSGVVKYALLQKRRGEGGKKGWEIFRNSRNIISHIHVTPAGNTRDKEHAHFLCARQTRFEITFPGLRFCSGNAVCFKKMLWIPTFFPERRKILRFRGMDLGKGEEGEERNLGQSGKCHIYRILW